MVSVLHFVPNHKYSNTDVQLRSMIKLGSLTFRSWYVTMINYLQQVTLSPQTLGTSTYGL